MADVQREESFRSAIKNQKRRLSATKMEKRNSVTDAAIPKQLSNVLKKRDSLTPPRLNMTPPRSTPPPVEDRTSKQSTPDIRLEFYDIAELSPLSTPGTSPRASPTPDLCRPTPSRSPSPSCRNIGSPVPPGSPLLSPANVSPHVKRARSFNKELRRARSFRAQREKSCSRNSSLASSRCNSPEPQEKLINNIPMSQEISFSIKRAIGSRKGWKIMSDDGHPMEGEALRKVVNMIKDIEFQGFAVPERITIKLP